MGLSHTKFGKLMGVTGQAVGKAVHSGRLLHSVEKDGTIDPVLGRVEWERNATVGPRTGVAGTDPRGGQQAASARNAKQFYEAKLLELEFKKKSGDVIPVSEMRETVLELTRRARDQFLAMAARLAPQVIGLATSQDAYELMAREINDALDGVATMPDEKAEKKAS